MGQIEEHKTSENMKIFFTKLLELKSHAEKQRTKTKGAEHLVWAEVWEMLDAIVKEKQ